MAWSVNKSVEVGKESGERLENWRRGRLQAKDWEREDRPETVRDELGGGVERCRERRVRRSKQDELAGLFIERDVDDSGEPVSKPSSGPSMGAPLVASC